MRHILSVFLLAGLLSVGLMTAARAQNPVLPNSQTTADQIAVVGARGALLHHVLTLQPLTQLAPGGLVMVVARTADGQLLFVRTETRESGWVATTDLLVVNISGLPVMTPLESNSELLPLTTTQTILQAVTLIPTVVSTVVSTVATQVANFPTGSVTALVTLQGSRLNLRSGPSMAYPVVGKAETGSRWAVIGRNTSADWVYLRAPDGRQSAWAVVDYLQIDDGIETLPTITDLPPPPTPAPVATARTLLPTPAPGNDPENRQVAAATGRVGKTTLSGLLVFTERIGGMIYLYNLDQDILRPLTSGIDPALSPDGRQVAFTRDGGGNGLYVINIDGSDERLIYNERPLLRSPSWSPDGRWLVFSRGNGHDDCRALRGTVCLPDESILEALPPELQLDMDINKLVRDLPNQRTYHTTLARISPSGSDYRDIPSLDYAAAPDWNDAGIVYHSTAGIQRTADEANARSVQVANDALIGYFHDPDWQPGGGRIAFHRKQGSHWQIYAVNPDGSGLTALTRPVTALVDELPSNVAPAWSPDGQQIIYLSNRNSIESAGAWHFWVMNADGSDQRMLPIDVVLDYTFSSEQVVSWGPATQ